MTRLQTSILIWGLIFLDTVTKSLFFRGEVTNDLAFGIPNPFPNWLLCIIMFVAIVVSYGLWISDLEPIRQALILGGALALLYDRIAYSGVRDWLSFYIGVTNLADLFLLFGLAGWMMKKREVKHAH